MSRKMTFERRMELINALVPESGHTEIDLNLVRELFADLQATEDALDQAETEIIYLEKANHMLEEDYHSLITDSKYSYRE